MTAPLPLEVQSAGLGLIGFSQFLRLLPVGVLISMFLHCCGEHCVVIVHLEDGVLFCDGISVGILERLWSIIAFITSWGVFLLSYAVGCVIVDVAGAGWFV